MKFTKKALILATLTAVSLSSAACSNAKPAADSVKPTASAQAKAPEKKTDLVVAGVVFQEDQFMKLLSLGYQDAAKAAGVKVLTGNTANDQGKEAELVNTYISQKVNGIAISPLNQDSSFAILKKADEAGVKIALTNTALTNASFAVGGYTSDNKNIGEITGKAAAQYIKEKLDGKAKIAVLQFKSQLPQQSADRVNGFLDEVKKVNPNVEVVADQDAWIQDKAVSVTGDILTAHPDINIIWSANEGGTIGATMAVKNAGKAGKVAVFGTDASDQLISMLKDKDNILQAITGQNPYDIGYKAMDLLIKGLKGEDISANKGKTNIIDGILLSRTNPDGIAKFEADLKAKMGK
ncbi:substrate-binding domain-containing protein [Paenibacillus aceris]|uniref:Simple sugar transport system substrate-binding protein/ribose transport system substrate-binding protein n=1 Tax=Paenibacillus aceris TaxID=869555 RepID=A0ABS4I460_9BACL|nr:substrate-binding domain-containing protein [Paenibacillus aceris]MBP1964944.1 simple sugar transport system substrate-binding protein/ribose transport system substrate-binding protein [Paenibacillus aceris]NHW35605.1 sugar ABC transporter substrate-binding protein [Paenibacillus aceris]